MFFKLVHEVGNRQRWITTGTMTTASAELIADDVSVIAGVSGVKVNPRTGSVIVFYDDACGLVPVAEYLKGLAAVPPMMRDARKAHVEALQKAKAETQDKESVPTTGAPALATVVRAMRSMPLLRVLSRPLQRLSQVVREPQSGELDFSPLVRWVVVRPFMPLVINALNAVLGAIPFLIEGAKQLRRGKLTVEVLDAAAIGISLLRRDFKTAGLVALLLGLGEMLENYTRKKSLESLADQLALKVDRVWVRKGETVVEVPLVEVSESDVIVVRAGSTIPVDGTVVGGEADVNQATMTGEPLPVHRTHGGQVYAGTVVEDGEIDIRPTKLAGETRLSKIIEFIETSEKSKAGIQGKAERLADAIVPYNFALAGLVFLLTRNLTRTAGVLMVDYSCALRLATPLAILAGMKTGTKNGTLIKGGRYLEALAEVDTVVFDKTGTLTAASPKLSDVVTLDAARDENELLSLAACLEEHFPHPVSRAVVQAAVDRDLDHFIEKHDAQVNYVVAHGICSSVDSAKVIIGSRHFVEDDEGVDCSTARAHVERLAREGKSILYIACAGKLIGLLGIVDPIREESARVIAELKKRGIKRVVMLTGDDERTAAVVAAQIGVDEYRAQVLPTDKAGYVQRLKAEGCKVLVVGDGINDSPALSAADVGATLREGSAIAQEVADVVLTRNTLEDLPRAIDLGRAVMKRVKTNFVTSVGLNSAFMAGGVTGLLQPAMGAVLHNLTTIGVCLNAMRPADNGRIEWHDVIEKVREVLLQQPHTEHLAGLLDETSRL